MRVFLMNYRSIHSVSSLILLELTDGFCLTWQSSFLLLEESESPMFGLSVWYCMHLLNRNVFPLATEMQDNVLMGRG